MREVGLRITVDADRDLMSIPTCISAGKSNFVPGQYSLFPESEALRAPTP